MLKHDFRGKSGRKYQYTYFGPRSELPIQAGVFIFAKGSPQIPSPVYIEAANLMRKHVRNSALWLRARDEHGATLIFVHTEFGSDPDSRMAEQDDLKEAYQPPMNDG